MYPGLACQIHAGYMRDTCGIHAGYMLKERIFSQHVRYMWIHARHARYKAQVCILAQPIRYMQDTCRIHAGYMQDTCGIRGSSVYLGTAVQIRSRYAGYVLKMCRICAGTGCVDVSRVRFGDLAARRGEVVHQSGLHVFHPLRQIHSRYIRIHHNT